MHRVARPLILALALATPLGAAPPQFWRLEGAPAFLEGELEGVSIDSDGRLRLGPAPRPLFDPEAASAWCVARDANGVLYVGTGNEGRLVRLADTTGSVLFDAEELGVHAVAVAADGRVYAATSPDGAVYAIDGTGRATRFFDPAEKYIWALAFDRKGALYVATGGEGRVYRVRSDGSAETLLASTETHILSLAVGPDDRVYAGSAPEGLVYRFSASGKPFVVLDSPFREIKALDVAGDGSLYAAAIDGRAPESTARPAATAQAPAAAAAASQVVAEVTVSESFALAAPAPAVGGPVAAGAEAAPPKGALLRIRPSGDVTTLWSSPEDVPYSATRVGDGVLVGTGAHGKVYRVSDDGRWALVATLPAEQVTGVVATGATSAALVTANPARVLGLDAGAAARGHFVSKVKDAEALSIWGRLAWEGEAPRGTEVRIDTRSGNTASPDATWTDWATAAEPATHPEKARFLQLRLTLSGAGGATPTVEAVSAAYLQRNLAPVIRSITVHPAGEAFQKPISASGEPEILGLDVDPLSERAAAARPPAGTPPAISFSRKLYQRGLRTFSWQAEDPNGDALLFDIFYRAQRDQEWRPLRTALAEPVFAWDTATVPSGRYLLRVVGSDAPGNPPALALTGSKDTTSFEVDNAPPRISATLDPAARDVIRVAVHDEATPIRRLELSVEAGRWEELHPEDGIADSTDESYRISLPAAPAKRGNRVVVLRASDLLGNVATARVDVP